MIGKLTIDKSSMNVSFFLYTIEIIYSNGGIISRADFIKEMAKFVGVPEFQNGKENRTAYNKSKLPRYFGFVDILYNDHGSHLILTNRGYILKKYIGKNDISEEPSKKYIISNEHKMEFINLIFESVIFDSFGKNNNGAEQSNTDVEPPKIVFKTILELGSATAEEICYVIFGLNNCLFSSFNEAIDDIKEKRENGFHDYSAIMEEWGIANIVNDCKIINIFTDNNIKLLVSERNSENNKIYYKLSDIITDAQKKQIKTIDAIYKPLELFVYTNGSIKNVSRWVNDSILGRISDSSQIFCFDGCNNSKHFCMFDNKNGFEPGIFERAIMASYEKPNKNIYVVLKNISENFFLEKIKDYRKLLDRISKLDDEWNGWSKESLKDEKLFSWLINKSQRARNILKDNNILLPSNLHIVGMNVMDDKINNIEFDYEFSRCFLDTKKGDSIFKNEENRVKNAVNKLYYGVPGSGKSYKIDQICNEPEFVERVVFHPDYSNADFIGQIMPVLQDEDNKLKYEFIPGPFSNILKKAMEDPNNMYYLIIEEINRGNAAAIFGDIFQLLDRDENGKSKYCINNYYIADYVYGNKTDKIQLPSNLTIYATMNSSDQNVFTLDTAFQRRWIMKNVPNVFKGEQARCLIGGSDIRWGAFATAVNNRLQESNIGLLSTEDKGLGAYFVNKAEIEDIEKFAEKVFKYLWDDAFKMNRADLFKENFKTLSDILNVCKNEDKGILEKILVKDVYDKMKLLNSEFSSEVTEV